MIVNKLWCVYKHTSPSGKVYIGIAKDVAHRWRGNGSGYKGSTRIANAIRKYGWENFKHEVLLTNLTREDACKKEVELISQYDSTNPQKGYNLLSGGQCGTHSKESIEKIRCANIGHEVSEKTRATLSSARSIPIICLETQSVFKNAKEASTILGICETSIGKVCNGKAETAGGLHFCKLSDYEANNIPNFKRSHGSEKRVVCITTGEVFENETVAAKKYGVTPQAISHACTGKVKTCCGLAWAECQKEEDSDGR